MKAKIIIWTAMLFIILWTVAGAYGIIQLCTWKERHQQLEDNRFEIAHLQNQVFYLRELNDYIPVMEQLLTPLQLTELKVLSEQITQKKHREYERHEQPLLDEETKQ